MSEEKRTYIRMPVRIKAHARKLSSEETLPVFSGSAMPGESVDCDSLRSAKLPDAVVTLLAEMNNKLDMVLSLLSQDQLKEDFPLELEVVNISGAGINFRPRTEFKGGEHLEVVMLLSRYPLRLAGAIGKVLRQVEEENVPGPVWAFEFTNIKERDLETIVQFVFQAQREQIRNRKYGTP